VKRILVTGASSGIGRATATQLLKRGDHVVLCGRDKNRLEAVAETAPKRSHLLQVDLQVREQRARLLDQAKERLGGLDGVILVAGVVVHQEPDAIDPSSLEQQMEINLLSALEVGGQALADLNDGGALVLVASTLAHRPVATSAVYSATKAGLIAATKSLALAGAKRKIRVNSVSPGVVDTAMIAKPRPGQNDVAAIRRELAALHPLGRLGQAEEVAEAIVFVHDAAWMTGSDLVIDGGLLLG
jgi:3-oxoacyl-[acyl-carrier protein] reductase